MEEKGSAMTWLKPESLVALSVIVIVLLAAGFSALAQYRHRVQRVLEIADRFGLKIRAFKDRQLQASVDRIRLSADGMTWLRLLATIGCLIAYKCELTFLAVSLFVLAWMLDLFDGLKARAELIRRGRPTPWGKYLDPGVDLACFAAMATVLADLYPNWLIISFAGMITMRVLLFIIILLGRLAFRHWHDRLPSNILPESIAGKFKTVFIALSFGLVLLNRENHTTQVWSWWLLGTSIVLEVLSLLQQSVRAGRSLFGRSS